MGGWWCARCGSLEGAEGAYRDARCPRCAGLLSWRGGEDRLTMACPGCRAAVGATTTRCPTCHLWFVPRRCGACGEALAPEAVQCGACGEAAEGADAARTAACPACGVALAARTVGGDAVPECPVCRGLLVAHETLVRWTSERGREAPTDVPVEVVFASDWAVRYRRCPRCGTVMNRMNFAPGTGVILDVCLRHGYWLDAGELPRMLAFVRDHGVTETAVGRVEGRRLAPRSSVPPGLIAADATGLPDGAGERMSTALGRAVLQALVEIFLGG